MKLYHAAHKNYQAGDDLLSLGRMLDNGLIDEETVQALISRWEVGDDYLFADGQLVSFTADLDEARAIREEFNGGEGVILVIDSEDLDAEDLMTTNAEGYPSARGGKVSADLLQVVE